MQSAAKLKHEVTIQEPALVKEPGGGSYADWLPFLLNIAAQVENLSGNEKRVTSQGGEAAVSRVEVLIRYRPGVTEKMRVSFKGKFYNIKHVKNLKEDNDYLLLTCDTATDA